MKMAGIKRITRGVHHANSLLYEVRQKREIKDPKQVTLKNGRPATQGACPVCGTKVLRIGKL